MSKGHPRISVRFDPELLQLLQAYCDQRGQTVAEYIRFAVYDAMAADADVLRFAADQRKTDGQTELDL